tara:strand:+ start:519 stop:911 length:393 start_codon:yes stop_codon:yes gene_type:complete
MVNYELYPANISEYLDIVCLGLTRIESKTCDVISIEELRNACHSGKAFFFLAGTGGFCVLRPMATTPVTVHVWLAYSEAGNVIKQYESEIVRLASEIGAERLTFESPRKGYRRALAHWSRDGNNYHRSVP